MVQIMEEVEKVFVAHDIKANQEQARLFKEYLQSKELEYSAKLYLYLASEI